ncbi:hypothetical protein [Calothrix sp. NIES-2098]|uniref:hypothetical protein n=1 Tax=Calothrix sp. NIES-2098 TaxID=1954171 RepID=UPI000B5FEFC4|nr:hypothetical protein NIES2098_41920 [Calothrix sp. NIES-2098]
MVKPSERIIALPPEELSRRFIELRRRIVTEVEAVEFQLVEVLLNKHIRLEAVRESRRDVSRILAGLPPAEIRLDADDPAALFLADCDRDIELLCQGYDRIAEPLAAKDYTYKISHTPAKVSY